MIENYKPRTANSKIAGINKYLKFIKKDIQLKQIAMQQISFLEDVISEGDYQFLKNSLKEANKLKWYYLVWFLGATGVRVSELINVKVEDVYIGYCDIYGKGGKYRRVFIPKHLKNELIGWFKENNRTSGYLFTATSNNTKFKNKPLARSSVNSVLNFYAEKYNIKKDVVYPHSFRHRFAKNFMEKSSGNITTLKDILGHNSIRTTQIYLQKTSNEQADLIDEVVNW